MTTEKSVCPSCNKPVRHRQGLAWCQDDQMTEADLQKRIMGRAKTRGWFVHHVGKGIATFDSNGNPIFVTTGSPGWPDLLFFKPGMPIPVFAMELKKQAGEVSPEQWVWLRRFNACGVPAVVIRPSHLRDGSVNAILNGR